MPSSSHDPLTNAHWVPPALLTNTQQQSADAPYIARHVALKAGMRQDSTALTVNRLCGSGFQAVVNAAQEIKLGEAGVVLAAGAESMSQAPMSTYGHNVRWGTRLGSDLAVKAGLG